MEARKLSSALKRRFIKNAVASVIGGITFTQWAFAQSHVSGNFPDRPVRIIVPYSPGTGPDVMARQWAKAISAPLGQSVIVENKPGANSIIGTNQAAKSPPDGYTILFGSAGTHALAPFSVASLQYDPIVDFELISLVGMLPLVFATAASSPYSNLNEMLEDAKRNSRSIDCASLGLTLQLASEMVKLRTGVDMRTIPYKDASAMTSDVVSGRVQLTVGTVLTIKPLVQAGRLKALGITSPKSSDLFPGLSSLAEQGLRNFEFSGWWALYAPKGTPESVVQRLRAESEKFLNAQGTRALFKDLGMDPSPPMSQSQLNEFAKVELKRWGELAAAANVQKN